LIMMAIPAAIMVISPLSGYLADKIDQGLLATLGLLLSSIAMFLLATTGPETNLQYFTTMLAVLGAGQALFLSPNSTAVMASTPLNRSGTAAALLAAARNLGMLLGICLATLVFAKTFRQQTGGLDIRDYRPDLTTAFLSALRKALTTAALVGVVGVAISCLRGNHPGRAKH